MVDRYTPSFIDEALQRLDFGLGNPTDWLRVCSEEFKKDYLHEMDEYLTTQRLKGVEIYPESYHVFKALAWSSYLKTRVCIVAQDPYYNPDLADGIALSVPSCFPPPPSLINFYKEMKRDLQLPGDILVDFNSHMGSLALQGVLLLNRSLTVEQGKPNSHAKIGWHRFTNFIIQALDAKAQPMVFILLGKEAQSVDRFIHRRKHLVLNLPHPSPHSAHTGFFFSSPFSKANRFLKFHGQPEIQWDVVDLASHGKGIVKK